MYVKFSKPVGANLVGSATPEDDAYIRCVSDNYGAVDALVMPTNVHLYEGTSIKYRKHRVVSYEEVEGLLKEYKKYFHVPFGLPTQSFKPDQREELIVVEIFTSDKLPVFVMAWGPCSMFVMNDSGKTIDSVSCA